MKLLNEDYDKDAIQFLKRPEIQDTINNYDFAFIYKELGGLEIDPETTSSVTSIIFELGINPLDYLDDIPACYLYGKRIGKSFTIPNHVKSIGVAAFFGCDSLTHIIIPSNIKKIASSAFAFCESLVSVTIEEGLTYIDYDTFEHCSSLMSIKIPKSVVHIESQVFSDCSPDLIVKVPKHLQSVCESINLGISTTQLRYY